jgi:hypothetical protein
MATPVESAELILRLYEIRREPTMREARNFWFAFNPTSAQDYMNTVMGPNGAFVRMVSSYWDMACSFVVSGAIDANMFDAANGEHIIVFAKVQPILADLRAIAGENAFKNLEKVCLSPPVGIERVKTTAERIKGFAQRMQAAASNS